MQNGHELTQRNKQDIRDEGNGQDNDDVASSQCNGGQNGPAIQLAEGGTFRCFQVGCGAAARWFRRPRHGKKHQRMLAIMIDNAIDQTKYENQRQTNVPRQDSTFKFAFDRFLQLFDLFGQPQKVVCRCILDETVVAAQQSRIVGRQLTPLARRVPTLQQENI